MKTHYSNLTFSSNKRPTKLHLLAACLLLYFFWLPGFADNGDSNLNKAVDALLISGHHSLLQQADFSRHAKVLTKLYHMSPKQLIWLGEGRPKKNLNDALDILSNAEADGLNPLNYDVATLRTYFQQSPPLRQTESQTLAAYDLALSIALIRYLDDLHSGQVDPRGFNYPEQFGVKSAIDLSFMLKQYLDQQRLAELPLALEPKFKQYQQLKQALASYRQEAVGQSQTQLTLTKFLRPGDSDLQVPSLRHRLLEMGELTQEQFANIPESDLLYDPVSVAAVIHLQQQQGLQTDGVVGKQTLALLNQTQTEKIVLIKLAMERLRWLPDQPEGPLIVVNIPAFQLWAFHSRDDQNALNMKVVVGKAEENQTPILLEEMKYLEFMPYWNIPKSIMDKEILPKIHAGGNYLATQDIELVERFADDDGEDPENIVNGIKHGLLRARQLPGKKNPLGKVKFIFPNKADVYLHDTPFRGAFNRDRRDFSHGCVRVAEAEKLAEFVLASQKGWDKQAIEQAMAGTKTQRVSLKKSIPVLFYYSTVFAGEDNKLRFYPDIYGYDLQLHGALNKTSNKLIVSKTAIVDG